MSPARGYAFVWEVIAMIYDKVTDLLSAMGIDTEKNSEYISVCMAYVQDYVKAFCAVSQIPAELEGCCAQMVCGRVLKKLLSDGSLESFDFEGAVQSIKEGDVSISFDSSGSSRQIFASIAEDMCNKDSYLTCFRKIRW